MHVHACTHTHTEVAYVRGELTSGGLACIPGKPEQIWPQGRDVQLVGTHYHHTLHPWATTYTLKRSGREGGSQKTVTGRQRVGGGNGEKERGKGAWGGDVWWKSGSGPTSELIWQSLNHRLVHNLNQPTTRSQPWPGIGTGPSLLPFWLSPWSDVHAFPSLRPDSFHRDCLDCVAWRGRTAAYAAGLYHPPKALRCHHKHVSIARACYQTSTI